MQFYKLFFLSAFLVIQFNATSQNDNFTWSENFGD
ncbi:MAG: hypothetical protein ACJA1A_002317, partial [Saprospiraceae bacterium]